MSNDTSLAWNERSSKQPILLICLFASLIGFGQNALLVSLPVLVTTSEISLSSWSILIAIGTGLFIPTAPFWGKTSDRIGPKYIVLTGLFGISITFIGMAATMYALQRSALSPEFALIILAILRIIYGLTVSGLVPACQHWAILITGESNRLMAITSVSAALSLGRVCGPILAVILIKFSDFMAITAVGVAGVGLLVLCSFQPLLTPKITHQSDTKQNGIHSLKVYILIALLLCSALGVLHYSMTPLLESVPSVTLDNVSDWVGYLLSLSALATLCTQVMVVKKKRLSIDQMLCWGAIFLLIGYSLFLISTLPAYLFGIMILSIGNAILVPAYTAKAMANRAGHQGQVSGFIATGHTLGFSLSALLIPLSLFLSLNPLWLSVGLASMLSVSVFTLLYQRAH